MIKSVVAVSDHPSIEKGMAFTADMATFGAEQFSKIQDPNRRGYNVYSFSDLMGVSARDKQGRLLYGQHEQPIFTLTPDERVSIFRHCAYVFGVVSSRMKRISAFDYDIIPDIKQDDKIAFELKTYYQTYKEFSKRQEPKYIVAAQRMYAACVHYLPDLLPDMSNFNGSLMRWYQKIKSRKNDRANEIYDWLQQPNINDTWSHFVKKWMFDLYIHGGLAVYKEQLNGVVENFYVLPGGSVMPLKSRHVGGGAAFVQIVPGMQPQMFFTDEIVYTQYLPSSSRSYGMIPLDALVNKVAEAMLFDRLMADQADGTKPPEKIVVFGENSPFGSLSDLDTTIPLDSNEQKRIETMLNEVRKGAIRTISGVGQPIVLDMTRENTMQMQMSRQDQLKKDIALVFNMTNMEINESGSDDTSGRNTADAQANIEKEKGIYPDILDLETKITKEILPFRFGSGYSLKLRSGYDNSGDIAKWKAMKESGLYTVNEIRTEEMGKEPFEGQQFDLPDGGGPQPPQPVPGMM